MSSIGSHTLDEFPLPTFGSAASVADAIGATGSPAWWSASADLPRSSGGSCRFESASETAAQKILS